MYATLKQMQQHEAVKAKAKTPYSDYAMTTQQIAERLGCTRQAVEQTLRSALRKLNKDKVLSSYIASLPDHMRY
jgi:DNA-binding transcriptional regulator LsrR (DeoR family)